MFVRGPGGDVGEPIVITEVRGSRIVAEAVTFGPPFAHCDGQDTENTENKIMAINMIHKFALSKSIGLSF
jgi:hypothetical protein